MGIDGCFDSRYLGVTRISRNEEADMMNRKMAMDEMKKYGVPKASGKKTRKAPSRKTGKKK